MEKKSRTDVLGCPELCQVSPSQTEEAARRRLNTLYEENSPKPGTASAKAAITKGHYGWPIWKGVFGRGKYKDEPL